MFTRRDGRVTGILNDWDLAGYEDRSSPPTSRHRTGTATFMALDLLSDVTLLPRYCYDLESFAWILLWCAFTLRFGGEEVPFDEQPNGVKKWIQSTELESIESAKSKLVLSKVNLPFVSVATLMKSLESIWIKPMVTKMRKTLAARLAQDEVGPLPKDDFFTLVEFMKVLEPEVDDPVKALGFDP